jgi:hypothetical protein
MGSGSAASSTAPSSRSRLWSPVLAPIHTATDTSRSSWRRRASAFWLAHVYSNAVAHSVASDQNLSLSELRRIARREGSIIISLGVLLVGLKLVVSH